MKIRARANGNVIDVPDAQAHHLITAGIYEAVMDAPAPEPQATEPRPAPDSTPPARKRRARRPRP